MTYGCYSEQTNGWSTRTTQINKYLHNIFNNTVTGSHFNLNYSFTLPNGINARPFGDYACMQPT